MNEGRAAIDNETDYLPGIVDSINGRAEWAGIVDTGELLIRVNKPVGGTVRIVVKADDPAEIVDGLGTRPNCTWIVQDHISTISVQKTMTCAVRLIKSKIVPTISPLLFIPYAFTFDEVALGGTITLNLPFRSKKARAPLGLTMYPTMSPASLIPSAAVRVVPGICRRVHMRPAALKGGSHTKPTTRLGDPAAPTNHSCAFSPEIDDALTPAVRLLPSVGSRDEISIFWKAPFVNTNGCVIPCGSPATMYSPVIVPAALMPEGRHVRP
jgi:hypothetical protein